MTFFGEEKFKSHIKHKNELIFQTTNINWEKIFVNILCFDCLNKQGELLSSIKINGKFVIFYDSWFFEITFLFPEGLFNKWTCWFSVSNPKSNKQRTGTLLKLLSGITWFCRALLMNYFASLQTVVLYKYLCKHVHCLLMILIFESSTNSTGKWLVTIFIANVTK